MIGPELPAHLVQSSNSNVDPSNSDSEDKQQLNNKEQQEKFQVQEQEQEDDDDDDYGPALPPELLAQRSQPSASKLPQAPSTLPASTSNPLRRQIGPSFPSSYQYPDDSDDDDVGPKPLPAGLLPMHEKDAVTEFIEREERRRKNEEEAKKPKALKREEWMLVPPSASDLLGNLDTTKMKARQFARSSGPINKGDNSLWTETPAERQKRLADEVAGKKRRAVDVANEEALGPGSASERKRSKREEEAIRRGVDEYTQKLRGPSLVEQHAATRKKQEGGEEEDPQKAIWDHSRDMALGGRLMDDSKRNQMIRESKGLGDRFGSGTSGSFL